MWLPLWRRSGPQPSVSSFSDSQVLDYLSLTPTSLVPDVFRKIFHATEPQSPPSPTPDEITKQLEDAINERVSNNKAKQGRLGVIAGGEDSHELHYIPPTVPDLSTGSVDDIHGRV